MFEVNQQLDPVILPPAFTPVKVLVNATGGTTPALMDGPLVQPFPEPGPPFEWQTVRFFSGSFFVTNPNDTAKTYRLITVFRAKNYPLPADPNENPGGLSFAIDIYSQKASLVTTT